MQLGYILGLALDVLGKFEQLGSEFAQSRQLSIAAK
jgi:hypothetical protein